MKDLDKERILILECCEEVERYSEEGLHFVGEGLYEKGHLFMIMVDDKGRVVVE